MPWWELNPRPHPQKLEVDHPTDHQGIQRQSKYRHTTQFSQGEAMTSGAVTRFFV